MYLLKMKLITSTSTTGVIATANDGRSPAGADSGAAGLSGPSPPNPSPALRARRARIVSQRLPRANIMMPAMIPRPGAAKASVWKKGIGMAFWIAGEPGSADMVKVNEPSAMVAGIRRFGRLPSRNIWMATGNTAKATTNNETPP